MIANPSPAHRPRPARLLAFVSSVGIVGLLSLALLLGLGLVPLKPSTAQAAAPRTCTSTPFRNNVGKRVVYRIPAIVATPRGTLLAFAERRRSTHPSSDISDTEIVLARSTDRGCRWSAPRVIADRGTDTVGNPAPVVDTATGTVLLLTVNRPRGGTTFRGLHLQRSTDDGRTFTPYRRARLSMKGVPGWSGGLTGPGHAIQLQAARSPHRGRIVVPMGYKRGNRYGAYAIISDDHGRTWKVGYNTLNDGRIEGTVAELPSGRLWVSYRSRNAQTPVGRGRVATFASRGGSRLDRPFRRAGLPVVSVQGSALTLRGRFAGTMLFSSPSGTDKTRRQRMALFVSRGADAGKVWRAPYDVQLDSRPGSYSDLVQLDDNTVGVLYETGQKSWHERIDFRSLRISDVVYGTKVAASVSVSVPRRPRRGTTIRPTVIVRVPGTANPAGEVRVRLRGRGVNRAQTLPLLGSSGGRRVASFGGLPRGIYTVEVRYAGTSRIKSSATHRRTIQVR